MLIAYALRIELGESYRVTVDLLSEILGVLDEIASPGFSRHGSVHVVRIDSREDVACAFLTFLRYMILVRTDGGYLPAGLFPRERGKHSGERPDGRSR